MKKIVLGFVVLVLVISTGFYLFGHGNQDGLSKDILWGNGRIEGEELMVSTKFSGRIQSLALSEGKEVKQGELLAHIDSETTQTQFQSAQHACSQQKEQQAAYAADIQNSTVQLRLANKELARKMQLLKQHFISQEMIDQAKTQRDQADAQLKASQAKYKASSESTQSVCTAAQIFAQNLKDMDVVSPINGRVLYKLAQQGEVLPQGGRIASLINPDDLYFILYLPEPQAGKVKVGDEAQIRLDAYPNQTFPAYVSFISDEAEFTPKEVQTTEERVKLVFRVKLRLRDNSKGLVKSGMPGEGYIRLNPNTPWPTFTS